MTFLNPLFLAGLGAAAIPIIIHLLNLRKVRTIEFSTLAFLKELQRTQIRRIKLRQLLLLVFRTLLIVFIVLAFSRPAVQTTGSGIGTDAGTAAAVLFDNSASMEIYNAHGNVFRQAKERALQALDLLSDGDNAVLLLQSDLPEAAAATLTADRDRIRTVLRDTEVSAIHRPMHDGLTRAYELLDRSPHLNREIYIISDLQATHWNGESQDPESIFSHAYRAFVLPVRTERFDNAAVHGAEFRSMLFEAGKPVTMDVEIRNYGDTDLDNHQASVYLSGNRVAQQTIHLPTGGAAVVEFTFIPDRTGIVEGYIELDDDDLAIDNRYYFSISIPDQLRVLLTAPSDRDVRFIETALAARSDRGNASAIETRFVTAGDLGAEDFMRYHAVIAVNVPAFSDVQADRLQNYVEQGGGLIIFPGDDIDVANYNRGLLSKLQLPEFTDISRADGGGTFLFDRVDYDHPIFQDIFEERMRQRAAAEDRIESPRIYQSVAMTQPGTADSRIIIMTGGRPFLIAGRRGTGSVLLYSVHPGMQWSDFPIRGIFVPLIHRSLLYASAQDRGEERFTAGEDIAVHVSGTGADHQSDYLLVHPDGTEERIQPRHLAAAGMLQFSFGNLGLPGIYRIERNSEPVRAFAVNVHPGESSGEWLIEEEFAGLLSAYGLTNVHFLDHGGDLEETVQQSRYGRELWKLFAILAFTMALFETVLARDPKQRDDPPAA
jgi:hypothetical protein